MVCPGYINFSVAFYPIAEVLVSCSFCVFGFGFGFGCGCVCVCMCVYPLNVELELERERERWSSSMMVWVGCRIDLILSREEKKKDVVLFSISKTSAKSYFQRAPVAARWSVSLPIVHVVARFLQPACGLSQCPLV